jgi:polyisoprenoid-binding protein YceI
MADTALSTEIRQVGDVIAPAPGAWSLDASHTRAAFVARHMMVTKVRGHFDRLSGSVQIGETPEDSHVDVVIDAASIFSGDQKRDDHLRSPDFLDVEKYPTITFRSTSVKQTGATGLKVIGDLTIRDQTRPVELTVDFEGVERAPWGTTVAGFSATAEINREDWGMTWNAALETGGVLVGKKVTLEIETELNPVQAKAA